jgi:hypothetical protein
VVTCEDVEAMLPLVADGVLQEQDDPQVFSHLAGCSRCQRSLASHDLIALALAAPLPAADAAQSDANAAETPRLRLLPVPVAKPSRSPLRLWHVAAGVMSAFALGTAVVVVASQPSHHSPSPTTALATTSAQPVVAKVEAATVQTEAALARQSQSAPPEVRPGVSNATPAIPAVPEVSGVVYGSPDAPAIEVTAIANQVPGVKVSVIRKGDQIYVRQQLPGDRHAASSTDGALPVGFSH